MPLVSMLIKPASSACNMNCGYCFYKDEAENRSYGFTEMMSFDTADKIIASAVSLAQGSVSFMFQGGEPTLAGLDFFRHFVKKEKELAKASMTVFNSIQTNGLNITEEWARFLSENRFLVGLSLDGPADIHNGVRCDCTGGGTFSKVMNTVHLFEKYGVQFNILCVVTGKSARSAEKIYNFYKKQNFRYLQFIPCLAPFGTAPCESVYYLSPEGYGSFLVRLFDLWYGDLKSGRLISIRHFDNFFSVLLGLPAESCGMCGKCTFQFVTEGNGDIYPCDFYALDEWKAGNINNTSLEAIRLSPTAERFIEMGSFLHDDCKSCKYLRLCGNGCRRERDESGKFYYCTSYKMLFSQREKEISLALRILRQIRGQNR